LAACVLIALVSAVRFGRCLHQHRRLANVCLSFGLHRRWPDVHRSDCQLLVLPLHCCFFLLPEQTSTNAPVEMVAATLCAPTRRARALAPRVRPASLATASLALVNPESVAPCSRVPLICSDVNECLTNNGGVSRWRNQLLALTFVLGFLQCASVASCSNTPGSRSCACPNGYTGDGVTCTGNILSLVSGLS
jgi:hypothetical protein